ncbi:uncharacterized protein LOC121052115 isoform X4 [Rosa chinensis]|uniref:uncharacterized protein LOC121052115 isoform X4 n=1 Tax=Rosa chinensis TaxID=74649 RepID=UPI001AD91A15|nr:uncharacterized protein LOC121052115 isoform X4 [Rosa chinensis]
MFLSSQIIHALNRDGESTTRGPNFLRKPLRIPATPAIDWTACDKIFAACLGGLRRHPQFITISVSAVCWARFQSVSEVTRGTEGSRLLESGYVKM